MPLPALDANVCGQWTEVDKDYYNKLEFYLTKFAADYRDRWTFWSTRAFNKKIQWKPNMGKTMRRVAQEFSPIMRQEAIPELLDDVPTTDVTFTRERTNEVQIYRHRFKTREFHFLPEFRDFFEHLEHEFEDLQRQINYYNEVFIRTRVFHHSPNVYLAGVGLIEGAPTGIPNKAGTSGKTDATISSWLEQNIQPLSFEELFKIGSLAEQRIGMSPYQGSGKPKGTSQGMDQRWCLLLDNEAWLNFTNDPWVKENRKLDADIVNGVFKGDLFGMVKCEYEWKPLRFKYAAGTVTRPAPEIVSESQAMEEKYRTRPNPAYSNDAQYGVCWWIGGPSYAPLEVGPPPGMFTKTLDAVQGMNWNGKPRWTRKFLINCKDEDGNAHPELAEEWGEYLRAQAQLAMGIAADNAHNVLPIIYKRNFGLSTTGTVQ